MSANDMTDPSQSDSSITEIEELLTFAERVSDRIRSIEDIVSKSRVEMMSAIIIVYAVLLGAGGLAVFWQSTVLYPLTAMGLIILGTAAFVYGYTRLMLRRRALAELEVELRVVGDLVQMLSSLIEGLSEDCGIVTRTLLVMRLRRIKFSTKRVT